MTTTGVIAVGALAATPAVASQDGGSTPTTPAESSTPAYPPQQQFLDRSPVHVADVTHDGTTASIYRIESETGLTGLAGIELYGPDGKIRDAESVEPYIHRRAWRVGVETELSPDISEDLAAFRDRTAETAEVFVRVEAALETVLDVRERLRSLRIGSGDASVDAWQLLTRAYPNVQRAYELIEAVHERVEPWTEAAEAAIDALTSLASLLSPVGPFSERPDDYFSESFSRRLREETTTTNSLARETGAIYGEIIEARDRTREAIDVVAGGIEALIEEAPSGVPEEDLVEVVDTVESGFDDLLDTLVSYADPIASFRDSVRATTDPLSRASERSGERKSTLMAGFEERRHATGEIHGVSTVVMAGIAAFVATLFQHPPAFR
ncbi:hypothetical protein Hbl1158_11385 [Halobaculum sp. CBA1158]|uniref:hypothetical protein n=1 Tax=Halobaculum sp. CBA1158 TaxID=2904243 RepID=UPI001F3630FD|nr:hypothetical protein [Halobaculum sp. CBA1158]UIO99133.1 hypothetical protein Hbl1158_11385 [Halobaculum sp. CBA1158]